VLEEAGAVNQVEQSVGRVWIIGHDWEYFAAGRVGDCEHVGPNNETAALHVCLPDLNWSRLSPGNPSLPWLSAWRLAAPQL
jgi:hypothetical protein